MANFTQNISNTVRCFGNGPSTKWGETFSVGYTMAWGASKWGEGVEVITRKDWSTIRYMFVFPTFAYYGASVVHLVEYSLPVTSENLSETLKDGSGNWSYVFTSDTTNAEQRDPSTWTQGSAAAVSYTCQAAGSTEWS